MYCNNPTQGTQFQDFPGGGCVHDVCFDLIQSVRSMTLDDFPDDVRDELIDQDFINRTHGRRATYAKNCRGPLCRKAERDRGFTRQRSMAGLPPAAAEPDTKARDRDVLLNRAMAWHWMERRAAGARLA